MSRLAPRLVLLGLLGTLSACGDPDDDGGSGSESTSEGAGTATATATGDGPTGTGDTETTEGTSGASDSTTSASTSGEPTASSGGETSGTTTTASTGSATDSATDSDSDTGDTDATTTGGSSAGCGMALAAGVTPSTIDVGGKSRTYVLSVPDGYDPESATPLVFAWHGLGGDGALARLYYGIEQASDGAAIFVYPDGLPQANFGDMTGWNLISGSEDMDLFEALLEEMNATACVDQERIFSAGHSFGSYMSNALGCFYPDVLRAVGGVAGGPSFGACSNGQVAAWLAHDMTDQVVEFSQGTSARDQYLDRNGCEETSSAVAPSPCVAYDGCDADYPVHWCEHDEGGGNGHGWPSFAGAGIWTFFAAS